MTNEQVKQQLRQRFEQYDQAQKEKGEEKALEAMMQGHAELQKKLMGPLITGVPLAVGFEKSIPIFEQFGMKMSVVNISNDGRDGVLEIQRHCPYAEFAKEFEVDSPCKITCDMDVEAIMQAFPEMKGRILSKLHLGDCACIFKYERDQTV